MEEEAGEIQIVRGAQPTLIGFEIGATDQRMWGPVETRNGIELTAKKKKKWTSVLQLQVNYANNLKKQGDRFSPRTSSRECSPTDTLILAH